MNNTPNPVGKKPGPITTVTNPPRRYCGRFFTPVEIETIRSLITENPEASRFRLSKMVCEQLEWRRANGLIKEMSCRVAMLRMQDDGLIKLPQPRSKNRNGQAYSRRRTSRANPPASPLTLPATALTDLSLCPITRREDSYLWNEYIDRYHYLGHKPLPGAQLRFFVRTDEHILALLGFGAAAWKVAPRDHFIGWNTAQRESRLHLIVNNARFLILPWIRSPNLASRVLAMASRELAGHWQQRYSYQPVLLETFVETPRFLGTCYRAANWSCLGQTQGRGKLDTSRTARLPKKSVWVYPLNRHFRRALCD